MTDTRLLWAVYAKPSDYPQHYVLRKFVCSADTTRPTCDLVLADSLDAIHNLLRPLGLVRVPHRYDDESEIVETWM